MMKDLEIAFTASPAALLINASIFIPFSNFGCKGSANRTKNQIYLDFSKVQPTLTKG